MFRQEGSNNPVFSSRIRAGSRTYYFDVKKNSKDDFYLVVSESKRTREETEKQRNRIMVFEEDLEKFVDSFFQVLSFFLDRCVKDKEELPGFAKSFEGILKNLSSLNRTYSTNRDSNSSVQ